MEFARDVSAHFKQWLTATDITTFDDLCDFVVLEQFKNDLPDHITTYITERKTSLLLVMPFGQQLD